VRTFPLNVVLFSFVLDAQMGFECGASRLIAKLFELEIVHEKNGMLPSSRSYHDACKKLPQHIIYQQLKTSHLYEYKGNGKTFHRFKVIIPDGTKVSMSTTEETAAKYGEGQGHYVQAQAVGFYELSTGTFEDFKFEHSKTSERTITMQHMSMNPVKSLYLADAGYNGMAFIARSMEMNHAVLMQLKNCALMKTFLESKKRSSVIDIKLTRNHLYNHPEHKHLLGKHIKVRLLRTRGTSKLRSQVLITTLIDEKEFSWQELTKLYLQRYSVELAFRHLKTKIGIERIRKRNLQRIEQLLFATIVLYNMSASLRNRIRKPSLLPEKEGIKLHCFTLCIESVHIFLQSVVNYVHGIRKKMNQRLKAIKNCWFIYKPWRSQPRICHTPQSRFSSQKMTEVLRERKKAEFLTVEYEILARKYGQKKMSNP